MKHFIDDYFADEFGEIYSFKYQKVRKLKSYISKKGYKMYRICINGKVKSVSAHHVSYWVNVSNFSNSDGLQIDHIDGNRLNNHYSNLRRVTQKENVNNPITNKRFQGNTNSIAFDIDVELLKNLYTAGESMRKLAKRFNCSRSTIKNRLNGKVIPKRFQ